MIISYPASPSRIIVLLKTLRHIIENLKKRSERKERSFRGNRKEGIIFRSNAINKKGAKTFRCVARFSSKLNEFNLSSRGERIGFAFEKSAEFMGSELLSMVIGLVKISSIIA